MRHPKVKPSSSERKLKLTQFKVQVPGRCRYVEVPVEWDGGGCEWMMTADGMRQVERAKLLLQIEQWANECAPVTPSLSSSAAQLKCIAEKLLAQAKVLETKSPADLGEMASKLAKAQDEVEASSLREEIVRGFYGHSSQP